MVHIAWEYEESASWYHIYALTEAGEALLEGTIELELPQTAENTADLQTIVDALDQLAVRNWASADSNQGG
jgi:hypothetical protein